MARRRGLGPFLRIFIEFAGEEIAEEIIVEALAQALKVMYELCVNEGQISIWKEFLTPQFEKNTAIALSDPDYEWIDCTAGPYIDFMGEICAEGNMIMESACLRARAIEAASDELSGMADFE